MHIVYKIVRKKSDDTYCSGILYPKHNASVIYTLNQLVTPKIPNSMLYAYKYLEKAKEIVPMICAGVILQCKAENIIEDVVTASNRDWQTFWKNYSRGEKVKSAYTPPLTIMCPSLTPLREIH